MKEDNKKSTHNKRSTPDKYYKTDRADKSEKTTKKNSTSEYSWKEIVKLTREPRFDDKIERKPAFNRDQKPDNSRDQKPDNNRDQKSDNSRGQKPDNNRDQKPDNNRGQKPDNNRGQKPDNNRDQKSDNSRGQKPDNSRGQKPDNSRGQKSSYNREQKSNNRTDQKSDYNRDLKSDNQDNRDNSFKNNNDQKSDFRHEKGACSYLKECGGCHILKQSYEAELKEKQKTVEDLLKGFCKVETIIGMKKPEHYRNKVHVVFDHDRKGNPVSGVYEERTHHVVPVEKCLIHNEKADEIIASIRGMLKSFKIKTYDEDSGYGLLRHVMIRTGYASKEIMVVLVLASPILPSKNNFVKALLKLHPEITTIVTNVNDRNTSMVLGNKEQVIYGKGYIEDSLCGKTFRISAKSFYQINPAQTEVLYGKAIEMAEITGSEIVIDAYCGIGTIGILVSDHARKVIGVELNKDAVKDALINVKRNEADNIEIYNNDAGDFMNQLAINEEPVDIIFMDPPRTGSNEKFMDAAALLKPRKIVYISCNPVTLERDLKYLVKKGYKAVKAQPVDMFPWTEHVETVMLLEKKQADIKGFKGIK